MNGHLVRMAHSRLHDGDDSRRYSMTIANGMLPRVELE